MLVGQRPGGVSKQHDGLVSKCDAEPCEEFWVVRNGDLSPTVMGWGVVSRVAEDKVMEEERFDVLSTSVVA